MQGPQEIELKLDVPSDSTDRLERLPLLKESGPAHARTLRTVYFDTDTHKLHKNGLSLRVRDDGGRHIQTVKQRRGGAAGLFERREWESEVAGREPDLDAARHTGLRPLLGKKLRRNLKPIIETRVRRRVFLVRRGGSRIELALDNGSVKADGETSPLCEIELELKEGDPGELFRLAHAMGDAVPVMPATRSKAARGYELIAGKGAGPVAAAPVALKPGADTATAFRIVARACLHQIAANQAAVHRGDAEALHQMRVGIRRLRSAISLFKAMLSGPQTEAMKTELKWLGGELGPARELDVFIKRVVKRSDGGSRGRDALADDFRARRIEALKHAGRTVGSLRFRHLLLDAMAWIEIGDWSGKADAESCSLRARPIDETAGWELRRRFKKIRKQGAKLTALDAGSRHKLRIRAKKLRYACEFFAQAFPDRTSVRRRKRFVGRLKDLQDALGDLNDIIVHQELTKGVMLWPSVRKRRRGAAEAFAAGRLSGRESARFDRVMQRAVRACRKLDKVKPFWV